MEMGGGHGIVAFHGYRFGRLHNPMTQLSPRKDSAARAGKCHQPEARGHKKRAI
jgi:hypothetical protein